MPQKQGQQLPEDLGQQVACLLLEELRRGGAVDSAHQVRTWSLPRAGPAVCAALAMTARQAAPRAGPGNKGMVMRRV